MHTIYTPSVRSSFGGWDALLGEESRAKLYWMYCELGLTKHNVRITPPKPCSFTCGTANKFKKKYGLQ